MSDVAITCCSTVDLSHEWLEGIGVGCLPFNYYLDGVPCKDDFGRTHSPGELYERMRAGAVVKTSQVSVGSYLEHWRPLLKADRDVLHVSLSSGISGTYSSACTARDLLRAEFPDRTIHVVDSLCASSGYGLLVDKLAELRDGGMDVDELHGWALTHRLDVQHWFFSSDLTFFVRGGRISKAAGAVGGLLKICPVMNVPDDGTLAVKEKIRTKGRAERRVLELMEQLAQGGADYAEKVFICHSECLSDAQDLGAMVTRSFPALRGEVEYFDIGATIGCHTGPGTVALFYWGTRRP